MADEAEVAEHLEEGLGASQRTRRARAEEEAKRAARRAIAHIWSKTERMNCERALLSFGYGRWGRIKESAAGGTRLRGDDEIERFGIMFVCLCVGVPIKDVGDPKRPNQKGDEAEGIAKAREMFKAIGGSMPTLNAATVAELEPLISSQAHGQEYAERVHKLAPGFLDRLIKLKRLAEAVEREESPLDTFRAPSIPNGTGREITVDPPIPWNARDDAMLLLGLYKHGYRAYLEIRDDPELTFTCRSSGPPLPPPLKPTAAQTAWLANFNTEAAAKAAVASQPPPDHPASIAAAAALTTASALTSQGIDKYDLLPIAPASDPRRLPPPLPTSGREPYFPSERDFQARRDALLKALNEQERKLEVIASYEAEWDDELAREQRGEKIELRERPAKIARLRSASNGGAEQKAAAASAAPAAAAEYVAPTRSFAEEVEAMWGGHGALDETGWL